MKKMFKSKLTQALVAGTAFALLSYSRTPNEFKPKSFPDPEFPEKTDAPSVEPSVVQSEPPSQSPSLEPSIFQSSNNFPSETPSQMPSFAPSEEPTAMPTYLNINGTTPINKEFLLGAHNAGSSRKDGGTSLLAESQQLSTKELLSKPEITSFEFDVHPEFIGYEGVPAPTTAPTEAPSDMPSSTPSAAPSYTPSNEPSSIPTFDATINASAVQSSNSPSSTNSTSPSASPSEDFSQSPSQSPTDDGTNSTTAAPSARGTVQIEKYDYFVRHGASDALATSPPRRFEDVLDDVSESLDENPRPLIIKLDPSALSREQTQEVNEIIENRFNDKIWNKTEQMDYAKTHDGDWPSKEELLAMDKQIIYQNQHQGYTPYDTDFFSTYQNKQYEDRTFFGELQRGIDGSPIQEFLGFGDSVDKYSVKDVEDRSKKEGVLALDYITDGDPRLYERDLFSPEMSVMSSVLRFSPESKAGNAAMYGFAAGYAAALGLAGASLLANQFSKKSKESDGQEIVNDDFSVAPDNQDDSLARPENQKEESGKKNSCLDSMKACYNFLQSAHKASLPLAAIGQASLMASSLMPEQRNAALGVASGMAAAVFAYKVGSSRIKEKNNEQEQELGESIESSQQLDEEVDNKDIDKSDRIKSAIAMGVSAVLNVSGSDKYDAPNPVNVAAVATASALAFDSIKDFRNMNRPDKSDEKQSLAFAKFTAKLGTAALVMAQNSNSDDSGKAFTAAVALGVLSATGSMLYGVRKATDAACDAGKSWVERLEKSDARENELEGFVRTESGRHGIV
jgi:hypothetical protein